MRRSPMALAPAAPIDALAGKNALTAVGFEPTHPKIVELESTALDHSAKPSMLRYSSHKRLQVKSLMASHILGDEGMQFANSLH